MTPTPNVHLPRRWFNFALDLYSELRSPDRLALYERENDDIRPPSHYTVEYVATMLHHLNDGLSQIDLVLAAIEIAPIVALRHVIHNGDNDAVIRDMPWAQLEEVLRKCTS